MAKESNDLRTQMTAQIRGRLKVFGIKARVSGCPSNARGIRISPIGPRIQFSDEDQRTFRTIAVINGLTAVRGMAIDVDRMTDPFGSTYYLSDEKVEQMRRLHARYPSIYAKAVQRRDAA